MECRTLNLTIISAEDLKKVNLFSKMDVYVVVSLLDSTLHHNFRNNQRTPVDKQGNKNPRWNFPINFTLNDAALQSNRLTFLFQIFSHRSFLPDTLIGQVHVPSSDLLSSIGKAGSSSHVTYQVRKRSGKPKGVLNFSYSFGNIFTPAPPPDMAAGGPTVGYAYPPPPPAAGYPQYGYGYGYGQAPVAQVVQSQRRNRAGMGLGAGLVGGALAGLVVGDLVSDIGHDGGYYDDGGYDGGYDDGGFDFGGGFDF